MSFEFAKYFLFEFQPLRGGFSHRVPRADGPLVAQVAAPEIEHRADALTDARPHGRPDLGREEWRILVQRRDDLPGRVKRTYAITDEGRRLLDTWATALRTTEENIAAFLRRYEKEDTS